MKTRFSWERMGTGGKDVGVARVEHSSGEAEQGKT